MEKKFKAVFVFGGVAVSMYEDNPDIDEDVLLEHGDVEHVSFDTEAELIAYTKGATKAIGWNDVTRAYNLEKAKVTKEKVNIDGTDYQIIASDELDPFERMALVKPGQAIRYYDRYMYRKESGVARVCYADNPSNNWEV